MWDLGSQQGSDYLSFVGKKEKASEKLYKKKTKLDPARKMFLPFVSPSR